MAINESNDEIRLQVIIAMLEQFPVLKGKIKQYLKQSNLKK
ncbi:MAG TPA: hypothetical protein VMT06_01800 [Candidatus Eisenbacteria bacterium]|nr:hypothetical protein [Candidatus Eisenbacteria bacterium]